MVDAGADAPARTGTDIGSLDAAEQSPPQCPEISRPETSAGGAPGADATAQTVTGDSLVEA